MDSSLIEKLSNFVILGEQADEEYLYDRWNARVSSFIETALGVDEANNFTSIEGSYWTETLSLKLGFIEGRLIKEAAVGASLVSASRIVTTQIESLAVDSRKVFLVHGHDNEAKEMMARFLEKLDLQPIILHEQPNEGRTIIEKFENYSQDVAFAIVLLTPDDVGRSTSDSTNLKKRARQNVIMELGYFIGKLGRNRVCAVHKGGVELPSDYQGVLYIEMDHGGAWKLQVAQELVKSKVRIELSGWLGG